jgi:hypothetical protein
MLPRAILILVAVVSIALTASCGLYVGATSDVKRTALEKAELAYATGSLDYEVAMDTIYALRAKGLCPDALWRRADATQVVVREYAPKVRAGLTLWRQLGAKPADFDANVEILTSARDVAKDVQKTLGGGQ